MNPLNHIREKIIDIIEPTGQKGSHLYLKNLMTTTKGKQIAEGCHLFMVDFLKQLKLEREGEL